MTELYHTIEDIRSEFEVDDSGKVWATARGTARLAGTSASNLLDNRRGLFLRLKEAVNENGEVIDKNFTECLKPFAGFDYWTIGKVPDSLVYAIVCYYAWESKATNETAKRVAMAMGSVGVRTWMHRELGWKDESDEGLIGKILSKQTENQERIIQRITAIESTIAARLSAEHHHPGIGNVVDSLATTHLLVPAGLKEPFTAREYVRIVHNHELTTSESMSLGRFAADSFTSFNLQKPDKYHGNKRVYYFKDLHAWNVVYQSWLESQATD